jgi:hypothetical protein
MPDMTTTEVLLPDLDPDLLALARRRVTRASVDAADRAQLMLGLSDV